MGFEQKEGSGALFKADQKGNDRAPNYRGDIMLGGTVWELAGWIKVSAKGDKFFSLSGKVKGERHVAAPKHVEVDIFDENTPF